MVTQIYIGNDKLDLFEDENINLNSSIADVSDITKNTTDFTYSFSVPASNTNNEIFKHYYDANIDGGFDARVKVDGKIQLDGMPFKIGKFRLNGVKIKNGQPSSYSLNFWGNLVALKDLLKNDELKDLDLSAYEHDYTFNNVKQGLQSSLFSGDVVYNLLVKKQYYYNSDSGDNTQEDNLANIAYGGGANTGVIWSDLSPSIRLIRIIEAVENDYGVTFSRDFFGRSEFTDLFLYANNKNEQDTTEQLVDFTGGDTDFIDLSTDTGTYGINANFYRWRFDMDILPASGFEGVVYTAKCEVNGEIFAEQEFTNVGNGVFTTEVDRSQVEGDEIIVRFFIEAASDFDANIHVRQRVRFNGSWFNDGYNTTGSVSISKQFTFSQNLPEIKTIELLKGIFKAFKLVIIPQDDGTYYVNTLDDYYAEGSLLNITDYVDVNNYEVTRGKLLNEILFQFEEPSTILNIQFNNNTGNYYGDEQTYLYDDNGDLLDGETYDYSVPFEQVLYERLPDLNDNFLTNIQYGAIVDEEVKPASIKAHIYYNINKALGSKNLGIINSAGTKELLSGYINIPHHANSTSFPTNAFLFSEEYSVWNGVALSDNLYTNYHQNYIQSIFNKKRRNFKYTAKNFPLRLLTELSLNDVVQIKSDYYRIDNYNINLLTGEIDFELINSFDNTIVGFSPAQTTINATYEEQTKSIYVVGLGNYTSTKINEGFGTGWVTVGNTGNNLDFDIEENNTGVERLMTVNILNNDTLQEFDISITQDHKRVTLDNNVITLDSTLVTLDSN